MSQLEKSCDAARPDNKRQKVSSMYIEELLQDPRSCKPFVSDSTSLEDEKGNSDRTKQRLVRLDLSGRDDFGNQECLALAQWLLPSSDKGSKIIELAMNRLYINNLNEDAFGVLAESLKMNKTLIRLDLERNGLGTKGGKVIGRVLAINDTLKSLNLSLNDLKAKANASKERNGESDSAEDIGRALAVNSSLQELILVRSALGPKGGTALAKYGLAQNKGLIRLDLEGNDLMATGGYTLGEALCQNTTLRELNLRWNRIGCGGNRGIQSLAAALSHCGLEKLNMSVNELYSDGAVSFGKALCSSGPSTQLMDLNLERNEIGTEGAVALGEALKVTKTLKRLVLSGNPTIKDDGATAIGLGLISNRNLEELEMANCQVGVEGGCAIGEALSSSCCRLVSLQLQKNKLGPIGGEALAKGLSSNTSLFRLDVSYNGLATEGGHAFANALQNNRTLQRLNVSDNDITHHDLIESLVAHPSLKEADCSTNEITIISMECQLAASQRQTLKLDLFNNPLSSPPLGRPGGNPDGLQKYFHELAQEPTNVKRIRLMVLGFGGVGKSTFCQALTFPAHSSSQFHSTLIPLEEWDASAIQSWALKLGTEAWVPIVAKVFDDNEITGMNLSELVVMKGEHHVIPSPKLLQMFAGTEVSDQHIEKKGITNITMPDIPLDRVARAISSLRIKGYFSTVGAQKVDGSLQLQSDNGKSRNCELVDFAGQMEYLVSHQLLLTSLHTLCMVLQPAPSFLTRTEHSGSWKYWSQFLRALGDRRSGSLLLGISQSDKVDDSDLADLDAAVKLELGSIQKATASLSLPPFIKLDYRPESIDETLETVLQELSKAATLVAKDWYVPASYDELSNIVQRLYIDKKSRRELPLVQKEELLEVVAISDKLQRMHRDPQLFQRGLEYLEAIGEVLTDQRLEGQLLLDPIQWFASFLAHFIRDENVVTSISDVSSRVQRGCVSLTNVLEALKHEYANPRQQVPQIMSLVCQLELCLPLNSEDKNDSGDSSDASDHPQFLFPCLLPFAVSDEVAKYWPGNKNVENLIFRGHVFRFDFLPPGLFSSLLARWAVHYLKEECGNIMQSKHMWKNCAILQIGKKIKVLLKVDHRTDVLSVMAVAPSPEDLFVGAAKGQASVVVWMVHLIKAFVRQGYPQVNFNESFLCPNFGCGNEYPLRKTPINLKINPQKHNCQGDGCWSFVGTGHKMEPTLLKEDKAFCASCQQTVSFALRSGA